MHAEHDLVPGDNAGLADQARIFDNDVAGDHHGRGGQQPVVPRHAALAGSSAPRLDGEEDGAEADAEDQCEILLGVDDEIEIDVDIERPQRSDRR